MDDIATHREMLMHLLAIYGQEPFCWDDANGAYAYGGIAFLDLRIRGLLRRVGAISPTYAVSDAGIKYLQENENGSDT